MTSEECGVGLILDAILEAGVLSLVSLNKKGSRNSTPPLPPHSEHAKLEEEFDNRSASFGENKHIFNKCAGSR